MGSNEPVFSPSVIRRVHDPRRPQQEDACECTWSEVQRLQTLKRIELERVESMCLSTEMRVAAILWARRVLPVE